jgi:hypothetical protein
MLITKPTVIILPGEKRFGLVYIGQKGLEKDTLLGTLEEASISVNSSIYGTSFRSISII